MRSYVLVHGAWSGAFRWKAVRPLLWAAGNEAYSPSLTGLGDRAHLASPETSLETHIDDVVNLIKYEDLSDIVLVGHSYGGMVVTGVAGAVPERITHLIYVDAFLPKDGQSCYDLGGGGGPPKDGSWLHPVPVAGGAANYPQTQQGVIRSPQPVKTLSGKVSLPRPLEELPFSRTYIKATGEPRPAKGRQGNFWDAADMAKVSAKWRYMEMPYGHNIPWEHPEELAKILLEYA